MTGTQGETELLAAWTNRERQSASIRISGEVAQVGFVLRVARAGGSVEVLVTGAGRHFLALAAAFRVVQVLNDWIAAKGLLAAAGASVRLSELRRSARKPRADAPAAERVEHHESRARLIFNWTGAVANRCVEHLVARASLLYWTVAFASFLVDELRGTAGGQLGAAALTAQSVENVRLLANGVGSGRALTAAVNAVVNLASRASFWLSEALAGAGGGVEKLEAVASAIVGATALAGDIVNDLLRSDAGSGVRALALARLRVPNLAADASLHLRASAAAAIAAPNMRFLASQIGAGSDSGTAALTGVLVQRVRENARRSGLEAHAGTAVRAPELPLRTAVRGCRARRRRQRLRAVLRDKSGSTV